MDDLGRYFTPVSQNLDDSGRLLVYASDGTIGYLDDTAKFVPTGPNSAGFSHAELQGAADSIQSQLSCPAANLRVTTVTQTPDGRIIVSTTGGLPTPAQRVESSETFW